MPICVRHLRYKLQNSAAHSSSWWLGLRPGLSFRRPPGALPASVSVGRFGIPRSDCRNEFDLLQYWACALGWRSVTSARPGKKWWFRCVGRCLFARHTSVRQKPRHDQERCEMPYARYGARDAYGPTYSLHRRTDTSLLAGYNGSDLHCVLWHVVCRAW